jgi:hypothetical protein
MSLTPDGSLGVGLTGPRAQDAGPHAMFADEMRLCLAPDILLRAQLSAADKVRRCASQTLFASYSRLSWGAAEVDLVLAHQRRDVVWMVPSRKDVPPLCRER